MTDRAFACRRVYSHGGLVRLRLRAFNCNDEVYGGRMAMNKVQSPTDLRLFITFPVICLDSRNKTGKIGEKE